MIGRIHRPVRFLNTPNKRGYNSLVVYKSHLGGSYEFTIDLYLEYDIKRNSELICIDFTNLPVPIKVENVDGSPTGTIVGNKTVYSSDLNREIKSLRKIKRPASIIAGKSLKMLIPILSEKNKEEEESISIELIPVLENGEEYMNIKIENITPMRISSESGIFK